MCLAAEAAKQGLNVGLVGPDLPFVNNYGVWTDEFAGKSLFRLICSYSSSYSCGIGSGLCLAFTSLFCCLEWEKLTAVLKRILRSSIGISLMKSRRSFFTNLRCRIP